MIDFAKAKVVLMDEYTSNNKRSDIEISAFHQGLNYMIDYILEEENEGLDVYDAADIWDCHGRDEDYMFGYTEEELLEALEE